MLIKVSNGITGQIHDHQFVYSSLVFFNVCSSTWQLLKLYKGVRKLTNCLVHKPAMFYWLPPGYGDHLPLRLHLNWLRVMSALTCNLDLSCRHSKSHNYGDWRLWNIPRAGVKCVLWTCTFVMFVDLTIIV